MATYAGVQFFRGHGVYNNVGLTSKASEEIASESSEDCRFPQHHCRLTPPVQGTPVNIRINLYCQKLESLGYVFAAGSVGLSSFKFS